MAEARNSYLKLSRPSSDGQHAEVASGPRSSDAPRNRLLASLDRDEYGPLEPHLENVELRMSQILADQDEQFNHVYFVESGVVSITNNVSGGTVEVGTIGNEGMAGLSVFLDAGAAPSRTFVQVPGEAKRMRAARFVELADANPALRKILNRYTQAFLTQVSQTAACNRMHLVEERCARWLLMTHDRVEGADTFPLTHQFLAFMLGARRSGVTVAAGTLQKAGLIEYRRGKITVLDRAGLEKASCDCYGIVRAHFDRLLPGSPRG
jgi:CRP-like cAMP-binding protein